MEVINNNNYYYYYVVACMNAAMRIHLKGICKSMKHINRCGRSTQTFGGDVERLKKSRMSSDPFRIHSVYFMQIGPLTRQR